MPMFCQKSATVDIYASCEAIFSYSATLLPVTDDRRYINSYQSHGIFYLVLSDSLMTHA